MTTATNLVSLLTQMTGSVLNSLVRYYLRLPRISMAEEIDRALSEEEFSKIVDDLTESFCLLRWRWTGAPGTFRTCQI